VPLYDLMAAAELDCSREASEWADIEFKYSGYLAKERRSAERIAQMDAVELPPGMDYRGITSLSYEAREKLERIKPGSLGLASRIPGVSPSDVQNLLLAVMRHRSSRELVSRET
jgi:tRNA uridine 5-carboxymethylaminomethyl modification enzyme